MGGIGHDIKLGVNWIHEPRLFATFNGGSSPQITLTANDINAPAQLVTFNGGAADVNIPFDQYAAYVQDDIRMTSRLTVNAGVRWDMYVPWVEKDNKQSNFDVSTGRFVTTRSICRL